MVFLWSPSFQLLSALLDWEQRTLTLPLQQALPVPVCSSGGSFPGLLSVCSVVQSLAQLPVASGCPKENESVSRSVLSNCLQPPGLQPARLLCPWDSPGKNTGVGSYSLLQGIFLIQVSNPGLPHSRQIPYQSEPPRKPQMPMSCLKTLVMSYLLRLSLKFFIFPKLLFKGTRLIFPWPVITPPQVRGWIWEIVWAALAVMKIFQNWLIFVHFNLLINISCLDFFFSSELPQSYNNVRGSVSLVTFI